MKLYSIKDNASQTFSAPYGFASDGVAYRAFASAFAAGKLGLIPGYASDYQVFQVGSFDETSGLLEENKTPVLLLSFRDLDLAEKNNNE